MSAELPGLPPAAPSSASRAQSAQPVPAPPAVPPRALTIPRRRLLGSPACLNCGTGLQGPFCHYCGQPDKNLMRFFPVLIRDALEDFVDFDSRFMRTLRPLLLHPGKLTRDYLMGRRFRYTPPMRLYIFSSMLFFILAAMLAGSAISLSLTKDGSPGVQLRLDTESQAEIAGELDRAAERPVPAKEPQGDAAGQDEAEGQDEMFVFNDRPWDREDNPLVIPGMPDFINDWINDEIEQSPAKEREIESNPNLIVDQMFEVLPVAVFLMLPFVALLFKIWYLFAGRYYLEHLIHALHNHAFLFVVFTLILVTGSLSGWLDPDSTGRVSSAAGWIEMALVAWIPLYLLISLKTVYGQGWIMTLAKYSVIGISYLALLLMVTSVAAVLSFLLL